jgi:two-component system sensor histidine kinase KdpD
LNILHFNAISKSKQYLISIGLILAVATICFSLSIFIDYKSDALILLMTVSIIAMLFDIGPVVTAAFSSALIWIWFFIPPIYTWIIKSTDDKIMILMYFIVASINTVLTIKIRKAEKKAKEKEEKEHTLRLYNTLLNSLSHELRTPISTIIGATDNLQTTDILLDETIKKELIREISKASLRLNNHVENLLNMSRLESEYLQPKMDWCDVTELIYNVLDQLKDELQGRNISVIIDENMPLVKLDFGLMEQVIKNLVVNAYVYTESTCKIQITAKYEIGNLILIFEDNGNGFPTNEIDFVFDKFYRLQNTKTGGTGLGLSIVKGFVEVHNGKIKLENKIEGGAKFTISIPSEINTIENYANE